MKVAAYQAPHLPFGSFDAVGLVHAELVACESAGVEILCCPEALLGGLAHESAGQDPADVALRVDDGELDGLVAPLLDTPVTVIIGFTERDRDGDLHASAAVLTDGRVAAVHRKSYPGYRTAIRPGTELVVHRRGPSRFGIVICNDLWYAEPVRILAATGAAIVFVPTNSSHRTTVTTAFRTRGENLPVARAVDNTTTIVVADVAGRRDGRIAHGFSAVVDPDGRVLARAEPLRPGLVVADVDGCRRPFDPRGWDGHTNPVVHARFAGLWDGPDPALRGAGT
jgi:predicted amidohydrolase